jgi:predicted dehydrogenase
MKQYKVLVVGIGDMGGAHARGYAALPGYEIAGFVVARNVERAKALAKELAVEAPVYTDYFQAMREVKPEVVSINTYVDTHRQDGPGGRGGPARVPADGAQAGDRLHPARAPGLDQVHRAGPHPGQAADHAHEPEPAELRQGVGPAQDLHRQHAAPGGLRRALRGRDVPDDPGQTRVSDEVDADRHNYGMLQVVFDDDSVGWYEVGWGPMMSRSAFFVKDVVGPKGCVSIDKDITQVDPSDVSKHTVVDSIILHSSEAGPDGYAAKKDQLIKIPDEPDHNELCKREQEALYKAITEDTDLTDHVADAVNSLKICFAAVQSYRKRKAVFLK